MPIQRQYSLPNCVFILEGLSNAPDGSAAGSRPELSVLTRFECYFAREKETLIGGRDLLEGLVAATNDCVQAWISGVKSAPKGADAQVQILPASDGGFNLTVSDALLAKGGPDAGVDDGLSKTPVELHLSTVQLFDLMEAVDQLAADRQTLPELQVPISPRSRRDVMSPQLVLEQSAPIALGAASVAVAAAAVFFIPAPKVPAPPKELQTQPSIGTPAISPQAAPPQAGTPNQPPAASP
ncbi:DUF4335 domain-containing protein [Altericista sp. CCNU0014]|uniref:DUF4335 domain-containing protein n=1 Tax=Altericista sp. CCNU0014 TaxID=3082949 RepID=UPI00384ABD8D